MSTPPQDMARDAAHELAKAVPPITVWALTLNDWLAIASIFYIVLQVAYLLWRWRREVVRRARAIED